MANRCLSNAARRQINGAFRPLTLFRSVAAFGALAIQACDVNAANQVRISGLSDVAFGSISNFAADSVRAQSLCLHAKSPPGNNYNITASGSGTGGAFLLSSGSAMLPFEVQWSDTPGQTTGAQLIANQPLTGQHSTSGSGSADDCSKGPATTASLIVILRSAAIAGATSGNYSGSLTLVVAPE